MTSFNYIPLEAVAEIFGGGTPRRNEASYWNGSVRWLTPTPMSAPATTIDVIDDLDLETISEEGVTKSSTRLLPANTVSYSTRATIGKVGISSSPIATNQGFTNFVCNESRVTPRYLAYALIHETPKIALLGGSTTFKEVSKSALKAFHIPIPSTISEQNRIVDILDQADSLRRQRRESGKISQKIIPAIFHKMFGGRDWETAPLDQLLKDIIGGWSPVCENRKPSVDGWGVLKLGAVTYCEYRASEAKALPQSELSRPRLEVEVGDVLFARKNTRELVGAVAYVFDTPARQLIPDLIFKLVPRSMIHPIYLWQALIQPAARDSIRALAGGAAASMVNISKGKLREFQLPLPPYPLQQKFAQAVLDFRQSQLAQSDSYNTLETLFQTLLHRAFDGTLTTQWREDQAKELLQEMEHQSR